MKSRKPRPDWKALDPIPRTAAGVEHRQRPLDQRVLPLAKEDEREDSVYQCAEVARLSAEMPRADVSGEDWGAYDVETLRIAGLCRTVLIRLNYCHVCTPLYCLKGAANTHYRVSSCFLPISARAPQADRRADFSSPGPSNRALQLLKATP